MELCICFEKSHTHPERKLLSLLREEQVVSYLLCLWQREVCSMLLVETHTLGTGG